MSRVTNIVIHTDISECNYYLINNYLFEHYKTTLNEVGKNAGGDKGFEAKLWIGAFNYFNLEAFADFIINTREQYSDALQIFAKEPEDDRFIEVDVDL